MQRGPGTGYTYPQVRASRDSISEGRDLFVPGGKWQGIRDKDWRQRMREKENGTRKRGEIGKGER